MQSTRLIDARAQNCSKKTLQNLNLNSEMNINAFQQKAIDNLIDNGFIEEIKPGEFYLPPNTIRATGERTKNIKDRYHESQDSKPLVSVVTVLYNDLNGLKLTLESIKRQTYKQIEHIVIDGLSPDSDEVLKTCDEYKIELALAKRITEYMMQ